MAPGTAAAAGAGTQPAAAEWVPGRAPAAAVGGGACPLRKQQTGNERSEIPQQPQVLLS